MIAGAPMQEKILASVEALAVAVRLGDWQAAEASDRAMREAVLTLAACVEAGAADARDLRDTLQVAHRQHLAALEQARVMAGDLRARLARIGVGRRACDAYWRAGQAV